MNKFIIISIILFFSLAVAIGWGWSLEQNAAKLNARIKTIQDENTAIQAKIDKGLLYAAALNLLMEPMRQASGLKTRETYNSEEDWKQAFIAATNATADPELQGYLNDVKKGGDAAEKATIIYMDYAAYAAANALK